MMVFMYPTQPATYFKRQAENRLFRNKDIGQQRTGQTLAAAVSEKDPYPCRFKPAKCFVWYSKVT